MPINWFTVVAQAINFLILVWLLKRFLYKPIRNAIDERERGIATQLAEAKATQADSQKERDAFQHKNEAFDQERATLLQKTTDEAKAERQRLFDDARKEADSLLAKRQEALQNEQRNLNQEIIRWTQNQVFAITRKALADLAGASLEERMTDVFVQRLGALTGAANERLAVAMKTSANPARVRSAFDLPPEQQATIQKALNETFSADIHIQFETAPELVSGIEISANGQKLAWSIADYLTTLEKSAGELLHEETQPDPKPDKKVPAKPDPKAASKSWPKREAKPTPEPVASAPKANP